jgi:hypothetical protein
MFHDVNIKFVYGCCFIMLFVVVVVVVVVIIVLHLVRPWTGHQPVAYVICSVFNNAVSNII